MIITTAQMVEMVRAYAVEVNVHKSLDVVKDLSDWVVHEIGNMYHASQVEFVGLAELAMPIDDTVRALYQMAMRTYTKAGA